MTDTALIKARTHLQSAWNGFMDDRNLNASLPAWQTETAADGSLLLSGRADAESAHALSMFVRHGQISPQDDGDTRPGIDYSVPGRVAYVWRFYGVWVELWAPDSPEAAPEPVQVVERPSVAVPERPAAPAPAPTPAPVPRGTLLSPASDRLPFTRNARKEPAA